MSVGVGGGGWGVWGGGGGVVGGGTRGGWGGEIPLHNKRLETAAERRVCFCVFVPLSVIRVEMS